jgi:esterase
VYFYSLPATRYPLLFTVKLFHRDLGGSGRPPLVILHGMLGSSRNWQTAGRDLATWYHVFALDLRNHGASPWSDDMTYPSMVGDVLAWLDAHGLTRVALMGHSMGGKVAMLLACRHPQRVERLVVVDIAPKNYFWPGRRQEFAAMRDLDLLHLQSRAEAEMSLESRVPSWPMRKFLTSSLERGEDGAWGWQFNLPVLTAALATLEANPLTTDDRYPGPAVFVTGGKSSYLQSEDWPGTQAHFPAAELKVIANSGHNPHMEAREEFVRQARPQ